VKQCKTPHCAAFCVGGSTTGAGANPGLGLPVFQQSCGCDNDSLFVTQWMTALSLYVQSNQKARGKFRVFLENVDIDRNLVSLPLWQRNAGIGDISMDR